ncbi:hypothetical protein MNBD_DELTA03-1784 [hydrothermal vent metagenome]|uniref:CCHC-type domain-containing protein n=1 Tax=hydrothermal vent metagenome TaxID=652676 RepID=A0A3B0WD37_9ZZZZ
MAQENLILAAIMPLPYQGAKLLAGAWPAFSRQLNNLLKESGFKASDSSAELLFFSFPNPTAALKAVLGTFVKLRHDHKKLSGKSLPLKCVMHLVTPRDSRPALLTPGDEHWDILNQETIYVTRPLKNQIELLLTRRQFPACKLKNEGSGLTALIFPEQGKISARQILAFRSLPIAGSGRPCFYCGMRWHLPADCPSKALKMANNGLQEAGYLPFKQINILYKKAFAEPQKMAHILTAGIRQTQIRKDPLLAVYTAFFDINRVYQPRFLWNITFSVYNKWESIFKTDKTNLDNNNLQLGFDCLRVKEYGRAEELLLRECNHKAPKRFYAVLGQAFLALERGRLADMRNHLELASNFAIAEKERIYVSLLLSRYYDLNDENWKARDLIKNAFTIRADCQDLLYRKVQLEVKGNFKEQAFQILRSLMVDQRRLYMIIMMDPELLHIQAKVEDILQAQYQTIANAAGENLTRAREEINDLSGWFEKEDKEMEVNIQTLANLEKMMLRGSYFDCLDTAARAKALYAAGRRMRENKLNELYDQASREMTRWKGYYNFWLSYQFPAFFTKFHRQLLPVKKKINTIIKLAKRNQAEPYRQAVGLLTEVKEAIKGLEPMYTRMTWLNVIFSGGLIFGKKLIVAELALAAVAMAIVFIAGLIPDSSSLKGLAALLSDPLFLKKAKVIIPVFIAPLLALIMTVRRMGK